MKKVVSVTALFAAVTALGIGLILAAPADPAGLVALDSLEGFDAASLALAGLVINRGTLNSLFTGFKVIFNQAFEGAESQYQRVAMTVPSMARQEVYAWLGTITRFREWAGDRVIQNLRAHSFTIVNKSFENTVGVDRDDINDDSYGVYSPIVSQMGLDAATHPDELVFQLMKDGFTEKCYDGQFFFDTDHPVLDENGVEQSVSNFGGGSGAAWYLLDNTRMIKPFIFQTRQNYDFQSMTNPDDENVFMRKQFLYGVDARVNAGYGLWQLAYASKDTLDATNYEAARVAMMSMKGDNGRPLGLKPRLLVVPPSLEKTALDILQAEKTGGGDTNVYRGTAELLVVPWLA